LSASLPAFRPALARSGRRAQRWPEQGGLARRPHPCRPAGDTLLVSRC
jgi:hypothetical protein